MPEEFIAISPHQLSISPWLYLVLGKLFYTQFGKYGENYSTENLRYGEP